MIKILLVIFAVLPSVLWSQYDSKGDKEISRFKPGSLWYFNGLTPSTEQDSRKYDRLIFDLTYSDWVGDVDLLNNQWTSIGLNTNFMFDIPLTKRNNFGLGIGISHSWVNIHHNKRLDRIDSLQSTELNDKGSMDAFTKSKFGTHSFSVPVELRFRLSGWRHFKVHIGGKIGYQTQAYSKYIGENDQGMRTVQKTIGFHDEQKLLYSTHVRIGVRNWALYASYSLNPIFENKASTELNHVQFGLSISLF